MFTNILNTIYIYIFSLINFYIKKISFIYWIISIYVMKLHRFLLTYVININLWSFKNFINLQWPDECYISLYNYDDQKHKRQKYNFIWKILAQLQQSKAKCQKQWNWEKGRGNTINVNFTCISNNELKDQKLHNRTW